MFALFLVVGVALVAAAQFTTEHIIPAATDEEQDRNNQIGAGCAIALVFVLLFILLLWN